MFRFDTMYIHAHETVHIIPFFTYKHKIKFNEMISVLCIR